jgi:hypothetical protein
MKAQEGVELQLYTFFKLSARWGLMVNAKLQLLYPLQKSRYSLYRRLGGAQSQYGLLWKISPPPGYNPQTVQPIVLLYSLCYPSQQNIKNKI